MRTFTTLALLAAFLPGGALYAQPTWTGGTGDWNTAGNWSTGVPSDGESATIDNGGTAQIDAFISPIYTDVVVASTSSSSGTLDILPNGDVASDRFRIGQKGVGVATVTDGKMIAGGSSLYVGSNDQSSGGVSGNGTLTVNDGGVALSGDDFQVASQGTGVVNFNSGAYGTGIYTVIGKFGSATWNHNGGVYAQSGGDFEIGDGGRPDQTTVPGPREGVINLTGGAIHVAQRFAISNRIGSGEVNVSGGGLAITGDGLDNVGDGRSNLLNIGRGANWNPGDVTLNGITDNHATLRVIGDQSVIAVGLDLTMDLNNVLESSNLVAQITGPTHTPILIGRNALIDNGNFVVELDGYSPVAGDAWSILQTNVDLTDALTAFDAVVAAEDVTMYDTAANEVTAEEKIVHNNNAFENNPTDDSYVGVSGPFASVDFTAASLAAGLAFEVEYLSDEVLLKVVTAGTGVAGDFNNDGLVNAADYTVWRDNEGTSFDLGGNGDEAGGSAGVVDGADYQLWKDSYGASASLATAVPEPATLTAVLAGLALGAVGVSRRR